MELDALDVKAAEVLEGYIVRKDLVRTFARQFPVPTYVVEFMLGRYCASTDPAEIEEGIEIVERQLSQDVVDSGRVLLFEHTGIVAKRVVAAIVAVLRDLINEEQRQRLDVLPKQFAFFVQVGPDHLSNLNTALRVLRYVKCELSSDDDIAVA